MKQKKYKMRYTINGIQQEKMIQYKLDPYDTLLLDTLKGMYASASFENIIEDGKRYIWVNQTFLLAYIPVFGSRAKLQTRLNKLEDLGFIERIVKHEKNDVKGTYSYLAFLPKFDELTEYETYTEPIEPDTKDPAEKKDKPKKKDKLKKDKPKEDPEGCLDLRQGCLNITQGVSYNNTWGVLKQYNKDTHIYYTHYIYTLSVSQEENRQTGQTELTDLEARNIHKQAIKDMAYYIYDNTEGYTSVKETDNKLVLKGIMDILEEDYSDQVYDYLLKANAESYLYALNRYNDSLMENKIKNRPAYWKKVLLNSIDDYVYETIDDQVKRDLGYY